MVVAVLVMQLKEEDTKMNYPEEWNELPKHERKKKIIAFRHEREKNTDPSIRFE